MKFQTREFIEALNQSAALKKSAEAFVEFESIIDKIYEELVNTRYAYSRITASTETNRKQIYDFLIKCHAEGYAALAEYVVTHAEVESLVYLQVHGLEDEGVYDRTRLDDRPDLTKALENFGCLTNYVDALILGKIILNDRFLDRQAYSAILEKQIDALKNTANEAQRCLAQAFVDRFLHIGEKAGNNCSLALLCVRLLDEQLVKEVNDLAIINNRLVTIERAFYDIQRLFGNEETCLSLLKKLELELNQAYQAHDVDLSAYAFPASRLSYTNKLKWPILPAKPKSSTSKGASRLLNEVLLKWERKYHINEHEHAPVIFARFIPGSEAKTHLESGQLFEEFKTAGNPLHGSRSHRLQWHIVLRAIDEGLLDLGGLAALEIVKESPTYWPLTFDLYRVKYSWSDDFIYNFRSPHKVYSTLLRSYDEFPALSGCLRKSFVNTLDEISACQPPEKPLSPISIIDQCDSLGERFNAPGVEPDVLTHYQARNKNVLFVYPNVKPTQEDRAKGCIFYKVR